MSRSVNSIRTGNGDMPPKGTYDCLVLLAEKGVSKGEKKTPYIELTLDNGDTDFQDQIYVTVKTMGRLCLIARRICGMPDNFQLSDDDIEATRELARYIMDNISGKRCSVTIEEQTEKFMAQTGPDAGRMITKTRRKVPFGGYDRPREIVIKATDTPAVATQPEEDLPF